MLALPTGWLYDLWAGTGAEQGQQPSGDVQQLQRQEEIEVANRCFPTVKPLISDRLNSTSMCVVQEI